MHFAPAPASQQPESFAFTKDNLTEVKKMMAKYPTGRQASAVIAVLDLAQRQNGGWLPRAAIDHVAELLSMPPIKVYEVATFYSMFSLAPVGEHFIQVCRTSPCWLRGSDNITNCVKQKLGIEKGQTTSDGKFTLVEVECLGACSNAPMVQINDDFYEDLDAESMEKLIEDLQAGKEIKVGSQTGRTASAPQGELTTLTEIPSAMQVPVTSQLPPRRPVLAVNNAASNQRPAKKKTLKAKKKKNDAPKSDNSTKGEA